MIGAYRYCGLTLASDLPLPELPGVAEDLRPDFDIVMGKVPANLRDEVRRTATFAHNQREALWWLDGVARFHVHAGGRRISVEPAPEADMDSLRLMLLHSVVALASVMRGDWMLNAAAVEKDGEVFALIGPSASGKSTAAALLLRRGFRLVSDGLLRLTSDSTGRLLAHPQAPWLQLWPDAIRSLRLDAQPQMPVRRGLALRQLCLPVIEAAFPLARIGFLREQRGNCLTDFGCVPRRGVAAIELLARHTAGSTWRHDLTDRRSLFLWMSKIAARVPTDRLEIPWGWDQSEKLAAHLATWCSHASE